MNSAAACAVDELAQCPSSLCHGLLQVMHVVRASIRRQSSSAFGPMMSVSLRTAKRCGFRQGGSVPRRSRRRAGPGCDDTGTGAATGSMKPWFKQLAQQLLGVAQLGELGQFFEAALAVDQYQHRAQPGSQPVLARRDGFRALGRLVIARFSGSTVSRSVLCQFSVSTWIEAVELGFHLRLELSSRACSRLDRVAITGNP